MISLHAFLVEAAKQLKHLGWGYYNTGKEGTKATHETVRDKVVRLAKPKDVGDYIAAKTKFSSNKQRGEGPLAKARAAIKQTEAHNKSILSQKPFTTVIPHHTYDAKEFDNYLHNNKLQIHTKPGSVGYAGPQGSNKITHYFDKKGNTGRFYPLNKNISSTLTQHIDQIRKQDAWSKPGKHHPVTSFSNEYKKSIDAVNKAYKAKYQLVSSPGSFSPAIKHYEGEASKLSGVRHPDHKKSVRSYTGEDYKDINDTLVNPETKYTYLKPQTIKKHVSNIDKAIASNKAKGHMTVYRGIGPELFKKMRLHDPKTTHFASPAYMSTSLSPDTATNFGSHLLITRVPKGHPALYAEPHTVHKGEREVIIPRGAQHKVVKVSKRSNGKYRIETELVHPSKGNKQ